MATYTSELDNALLLVPWMAKVDTSSKPYMLKYAQHPSKPGFGLLLTDLTKVYFEPLAGIRVLARQREVEEKFSQSQSQRDGGGSLDLGGEEAVGEVLDEVAGLMGQMDEVELDVKPGDLYDLDVTIKSSDNHWLYHMTEIRTDCLEIITRHVIHPLALSMASSRRPASTTNDQIVELVSSSTVMEAMNRHLSHAKTSASVAKSTKPVMTASPHQTPQATRAKTPDNEEDHAKPRLIRRRPGPTAEASDAGPSSHHRMTRMKSPSPVNARAAKAPVTRAVNHDDPEDESMPPEEDEAVRERSTSTPAPEPESSPPRSRKKKPDPSPEENQDMDEDRSPAPPAPSAPSQKTQQEKDEDEEEVLAKKREEMKRRMGAGGGGRLVRRRFG